MKAPLIETAWENYRKYVLYDTKEEIIAVLQIAFYAGARAAYFAINIGDGPALADIGREVTGFEVGIEAIAKGE